LGLRDRDKMKNATTDFKLLRNMDEVYLIRSLFNHPCLSEAL